MGRLMAYVGGALLIWIGIGLMQALFGNGWHLVKGMNYESHTTLREGLTMALALGVPSGLVGFAIGEQQGGRSVFEILLPYAYWDEYTKRTLEAEATSSAGERRRAAVVIRSTAKASSESLSPELSAYVTRNTGAGDTV